MLELPPYGKVTVLFPMLSAKCMENQQFLLEKLLLHLGREAGV